MSVDTSILRWSSILLGILFIAATLSACDDSPTPEEDIAKSTAATPMSDGPTATPKPVAPPTTTPENTPTPEPTPTPALTPEATLPSTATPTVTPTPEPTPTPRPTSTPPPLPGELTQGVRALVRCAGETAEYWLEHGPPGMTADLVVCLNEYLEVN